MAKVKFKIPASVTKEEKTTEPVEVEEVEVEREDIHFSKVMDAPEVKRKPDTIKRRRVHPIMHRKYLRKKLTERSGKV